MRKSVETKEEKASELIVFSPRTRKQRLKDRGLLLNEVDGIERISDILAKFYDELYSVTWSEFNSLNLLPKNWKDECENLKKQLADFSTLSTILSFSSIGELFSKEALFGLYKGEVKVIDYYNNTKSLPKLVPAIPSTKNWDAYDKNGDRYSIKTVNQTQSATGVWHSLTYDKKQNKNPDFEYVIIAKLYDDYNLKDIWQITWEEFLKYKTIKVPEQKPHIEIDKYCDNFKHIFSDVIKTLH